MDRFLAELAIARSLAVIGKTHRWSTVRALLAGIMAVVLGLGVVSCGDRAGKNVRPSGGNAPLVGNVSEVSPPTALQELRPFLETYQPQIKILSPRPGEVLTDEQVSVRLQVKDLPIYKDKDLGLGPHLHVILDNQPYQAVYDLEQPLVFKDLAPGTHTIRAIASRPWHETFKNDGAFVLTTFHVLTKTPDNQPIPGQPLLTYSRPTGIYGAEPIMLDFYLTNVPLHLIAQERVDDSIQDWRIRATVNGESFIFDEWQPIYLKGLKPGKNWLQLELLNEDGEAIANAFNNTVRVINYQPGGTDTLSKLVRGELTATDARGIVDPNYVPEPLTPSPTPSPEPSPITLPTPTTPTTPQPSSTVTPLPSPAVWPFPDPETSPKTSAPSPETISPIPGTTLEVSPSPSPAAVKPYARPSAKRTSQIERSPASTDEKAEDNLITAPSPQPSPTPMVEPSLEGQVERSPKSRIITPVEPTVEPIPATVPTETPVPVPTIETPPIETPPGESLRTLTEQDEAEIASPSTSSTSPAPTASKATTKQQRATGKTYLDRLRQQFTGTKATPQSSSSPGSAPSSLETSKAVPKAENKQLEESPLLQLAPTPDPSSNADPASPL